MPARASAHLPFCICARARRAVRMGFLPCGAGSIRRGEPRRSPPPAGRDPIAPLAFGAAARRSPGYDPPRPRPRGFRMRTILLLSWLAVPVAGVAYHYGPGQDRLLLD